GGQRPLQSANRLECISRQTPSGAPSDGFRGARRDDGHGYTRTQRHSCSAGWCRIQKKERNVINAGRTLGILSLLAILISGCNQQQPATQSEQAGGTDPLGPTRVATVDGKPIHESVFRLMALNRMQKSADDLTQEERTALQEHLIQLRLLAN